MFLSLPFNIINDIFYNLEINEIQKIKRLSLRLTSLLDYSFWKYLLKYKYRKFVIRLSDELLNDLIIGILDDSVKFYPLKITTYSSETCDIILSESSYTWINYNDTYSDVINRIRNVYSYFGGDFDLVASADKYPYLNISFDLLKPLDTKVYEPQYLYYDGVKICKGSLLMKDSIKVHFS